MLGTRTKQVFSYGRRGHRIVSVSERHDTLRDENLIVSSGGDLPVAPLTKLNDSPDRPLTPARRARRKIRVSSLPSPPKAKAKQIRSPTKKTQRSPSSKPPSSRQPLSVNSPNVPKSAAARKKTRVLGSKGTPLKQSYSPVVSVDIIVLDDDGRRVSQERRISHTDVQVNLATTNLPIKYPVSRKPTLEEGVIALSDSDDVSLVVPKPKRKSRRAKPIVISSDSSDYEEPTDRKKAHSRSPAKPAKAPAPFEVDRDTRLRSLDVISIPSTNPSARQRHGPLPLAQDQPPKSQDVEARETSSASIRLQEYRNTINPSIPPPTRSKTRQLTPIRRGRNVFPRPPSPPSPSSTADFDLEREFAELSLDADLAADESSVLVPEYLVPLLSECSQTTPHEFSAFIESFPHDPIVGAWHEGTLSRRDVAFQKIGEASYSEVFGIGDVVLKIIPIRDEDTQPGKAADSDVESPAPSDAKDVTKEMIVTRAMGEICEGFVELLRTYVVRGKYPSLLLDLWDEYNDKKGSESIRPDVFTLSQVYAIIVLPNGGPDLEAYTFSTPSKNGWRQACSLFWQVTRTLAQAEELVSFEHRDLHWGQILVNNVPFAAPARRTTTKTNLSMDHPAHGVRATVIDLGLSRMDSSGGQNNPTVHWTPFDEEIFEGEGDYQFDVYRYMRNHNGDDWRKFEPLTNVMWLHYLTTKLLESKRLRPPPTPRKTAAPTASSVTYTERECYDCLIEVEALLSQAIESAKKPAAAQKGRRKTHAPPKVLVYTGPKAADDVLLLGVQRGWVKA